MNKEKIKDFLNAYVDAIGLKDRRVKNSLEELMIKIISKYEKIFPNGIANKKIIGNTDVYLIKPNSQGVYSVEDFFLNRLMRNIVGVNVGSIDKEDPHSKGVYHAIIKEVFFYRDAILKALEPYKNSLKNYDTHLETSIKKVIMHEFEHALQTNFDSGLYKYYSRDGGDYINHSGKQNGLYPEIVRNLKSNGVMGKYNTQIISPYALDDIKLKNKSEKLTDDPEYLSVGVHMSSIYAQGRTKNGYRDVNEGLKYFDEVLNETESLEMSGHDVGLFSRYVYDGKEFYVPVKNVESSNYAITNFGNLFKLAFGQHNSFELMYLDPAKGLEKFNRRFGDIFQNTFGEKNKDAIEILSEKLQSIRNSKTTSPEQNRNVINDYIGLTTAFARCFRLRVQKAIAVGITENDKQDMLKSIRVFRENLMTCSYKRVNANFLYNQILDDLEKTITNEKTIPNNQSITNSTNINSTAIHTPQSDSAQRSTISRDNVTNIPVTTKEKKPNLLSFDELKECVIKYEIKEVNGSYQAFDRQTGQLIRDSKIRQDALMANNWLMSAGSKWIDGDTINGITYAFNDEAREVYDTMMTIAKKSRETTGRVDSVEILREIADKSLYKYSQEIVVNMFRTDFQSGVFEKYFRDRVDSNVKPTRSAQTLFNLNYAHKLLDHENEGM